VFAFDAIGSHASADERDLLLSRHRLSLLTMGVVCGFLGAAPSVLWASGAMFVAMAPLLVPVAVWIYALVFAFSSLWFAHFLLGALDQHRRDVAKSAIHTPVSTASDISAAPAPARFPVDDGVIDVVAKKPT